MRFTVSDALGNIQSIIAPNFDDAIKQIETTGSRNVYGIENERGTSRFVIDRGSGTLFPVSAKGAALELRMGGFRAPD